MKVKQIKSPTERWMSPYHHLIQDATGAPECDLAMIERIMREDIFHSTLDWQSDEQLKKAAIQARQLLDQNRDLYEAERKLISALFLKNKQEAETAAAKIQQYAKEN